MATRAYPIYLPILETLELQKLFEMGSQTFKHPVANCPIAITTRFTEECI